VSQKEHLEHFTVRIPSSLFERLERIREETHRSRTNIVTLAIEKYLDILENEIEKSESSAIDLEFAEEAEKRGMTPEELKKWLLHEVVELSEKYDRLEEMIDRINEK
jgi:predicted transcriptional regulator